MAERFWAETRPKGLFGNENSRRTKSLTTEQAMGKYYFLAGIVQNDVREYFDALVPTDAVDFSLTLVDFVIDAVTRATTKKTSTSEMTNVIFESSEEIAASWGMTDKGRDWIKSDNVVAVLKSVKELSSRCTVVDAGELSNSAEYESSFVLDVPGISKRLVFTISGAEAFRYHTDDEPFHFGVYCNKTDDTELNKKLNMVSSDISETIFYAGRDEDSLLNPEFFMSLNKFYGFEFKPSEWMTILVSLPSSGLCWSSGLDVSKYTSSFGCAGEFSENAERGYIDRCMMRLIKSEVLHMDAAVKVTSARSDRAGRRQRRSEQAAINRKKLQAQQANVNSMTMQFVQPTRQLSHAPPPVSTTHNVAQHMFPDPYQARMSNHIAPPPQHIQPSQPPQSKMHQMHPTQQNVMHERQQHQQHHFSPMQRPGMQSLSLNGGYSLHRDMDPFGSQRMNPSTTTVLSRDRMQEHYNRTLPSIADPRHGDVGKAPDRRVQLPGSLTHRMAPVPHQGITQHQPTAPSHNPTQPQRSNLFSLLNGPSNTSPQPHTFGGPPRHLGNGS